MPTITSSLRFYAPNDDRILNILWAVGLLYFTSAGRIYTYFALYRLILNENIDGLSVSLSHASHHPLYSVSNSENSALIYHAFIFKGTKFNEKILA